MQGIPIITVFISIYSIVAFACTNGGCTESQHFGPYSTQASKSNNLYFDDLVCTVIH